MSSELISKIYGLVNVDIGQYNPPTTQLFVSNLQQIPKLFHQEKGPIFIALCVVPQVGAYQYGRLQELVQLSFVNPSTTMSSAGGVVKCTSIFDFKHHSQTRDYFNIRPHSQKLIKKLREEESYAILNYYRELIHAKSD